MSSLQQQQSLSSKFHQRYGQHFTIMDHLYTLFLFTKSDCKTIFSVVVFASTSAPVVSPSHFIKTIMWIWIHLLMFDVANQRLSIDEDLINKPWRPLPSNRITFANATLLRWALIPCCILLSSSFSWAVTYVTIVAAAMTVLYNEMNYSQTWFARSVINAVAMGLFQTGATLISGADRNFLDTLSVAAITISMGILGTTIHASDFMDEVGDRKIGRKTLPIQLPRISRISIPLLMFAWSALVISTWSPPLVLSLPILLLGLYVGFRFVTKRSVYDDRLSYTWYNLWLFVVHILPGVARHRELLAHSYTL